MQTINGSNGNSIKVSTDGGNIALTFPEGAKDDPRMSYTEAEVKAAAKAHKDIPTENLRVVVALSSYLGRTIPDTWRALSSAFLAESTDGKGGLDADSKNWYHNMPIDPDGIAGPHPNELWESLGNVPVNDDGITQEPFLTFPAGTDREVIWHWFESTFGVSVADLMGVAA